MVHKKTTATLFEDKLTLGSKTVPVSFFEWINQPNPTPFTLVSEPLPQKTIISLSPCLIQTLGELPVSKSTTFQQIEKALYPYPVKTPLTQTTLFGLPQNGWQYLPCLVLLLGWAVGVWMPRPKTLPPNRPLQVILPFLETLDSGGFLPLSLVYTAHKLRFSGIVAKTYDLSPVLSQTDHRISALNNDVNTIEGTLRCHSF